MDLVASAENIIVAMQHTNRRGESKLLSACSLPLTGVACVKKIVTDLAVLEVDPDRGRKGEFMQEGIKKLDDLKERIANVKLEDKLISGEVIFVAFNWL